MAVDWNARLNCSRSKEQGWAESYRRREYTQNPLARVPRGTPPRSRLSRGQPGLVLAVDRALVAEPFWIQGQIFSGGVETDDPRSSLSRR